MPYSGMGWYNVIYEHYTNSDETSALKIAVDYYSNLFGREPTLGIHLNDNFWEESELVTAEENTYLEADLTEEEVNQAVFNPYAEEAPGPDGFSFCFMRISGML